METTKDITQDFGTLYHPKSALVFYETKGRTTDVYVEHFDMDKNGNPINAHPLTVREANILVKALRTEKDKDKAFLKPSGILPTNILYLNPSAEKGTVVWYTKAQQRKLFFVDGLQIPNGTAYVPPMVWKASKNSITVYALASDRRPTDKTKLHYAPFFNIYEDGKVCMGTVSIDIKKSASVEEFIHAWEHYFFNSYFSHLLGKHNPIKGDCVKVWNDLVNTDKPFPKEILKTNSKTLKNLL
ncbi:PRTRC system protein B [Elizabethkingia anophelis]|uniref:PRTRC system protein B n=1 Tax=Elizabethkingia anophelis TaxID=1117645 RepID=A0A455ZCI1_9FLAO|nr:PRTRC system protein B [Elizabethkingia anophelis]OJU74096.1 MAG: PRTRC system protein B [Bacteroidetes bacterium 47-18]MDV3875096.1 PRTRC system protein B [Elizabethkingia anophelis]MDV3892833.1 PRTRC system protein B [Elizabethkingia anophelis]MDV3916394.1 PRTRC system protein B [Elizabethkingia anophelis]MDV3919330.1 PRTRC system protein B [Elizabethkingia anophelis]